MIFKRREEKVLANVSTIYYVFALTISWDDTKKKIEEKDSSVNDNAATCMKCIMLF